MAYTMLRKMKVDIHFIIATILILIVNGLFIQLVIASNILATNSQTGHDENRKFVEIGKEFQLSSDYHQKGRQLQFDYRTKTTDVPLLDSGLQRTSVGNRLQLLPSYDTNYYVYGNQKNNKQVSRHSCDIDLTSLGITSIAGALKRIKYPLNAICSLNLTNNAIKDIPDGIFQNLTNLQWIDLSDNLIKVWERRVEGDISQDLPKLHRISLANNRFVHLPFFGFNRKVEDHKPVIDLTGNLLFCDKEMYTRLFRKNGKAIREEAVRFVNARCISPFLQSYTPIFDADNEVIIAKRFFATNDTIHPCPKGCHCYIRSMDQKHFTKCYGHEKDDRIPSGIWKGTNVLELIDYEFLRLRKTSPLSRLTELEEFHARSISLRYIDSGAFANLAHLRVLDLSGNDLEVIEPSYFNDISSLEILLLANNSIRSIASESFDNLKNLRNLTLNGNQFNLLPKNVFEYNQNLTYLTLRDNAIAFLQKNAFENNTLLEYLSLPVEWHCNCSNMWLKDWLLEEDCPVKDVDEISCEKNGESLVDTPYNYFKEQCDHHTVLTLPTIAAAVAFILGCLLVLRNRELVLVTIYTHTGFRFCDRHIKQKDNEERPFDAFIVFAQADFDFAFQKLYQNLKSSYKVCFSDINFIPNTSHAEMLSMQ